MRIRLLAGALLLVLALSACADEPELAAENAAREWLAYVDEGEYVSSWNSAATMFRNRITTEDWEEAVSSVREPLGKLISRKLRSARYTTSLPGAPDGDYVVLHFDTVFENKAAAIETVTPALDEGEWRVSGYYIQ